MKRTDDLTEEQEWWSLTPAQRFRETEKLWSVYLAMGGCPDPEPDSQSPFHFPSLRSQRPRKRRKKNRKPPDR